MKMDERFSPTIERVCELPVVGDVPDVYLVCRVVRRALLSRVVNTRSFPELIIAILSPPASHSPSGLYDMPCQATLLIGSLNRYVGSSSCSMYAPSADGGAYSGRVNWRS